MGERDDRQQLQLSLEDRVERMRRAKPATCEAQTPLSVSEIVRLASRSIEALFEALWVEGEVSNLRAPISGHLYFTLKDARAQLSVVMFRSAAKRLRFRPRDGQKLRCRGRLAIYEAQGRFQLMAEDAEPAGAGALQLAFERLKAKLAAEGLFDARHKKPLPYLPRMIAVVTSSTGAALRDIVKVLDERFPSRVIVCPTAVQGEEAGKEIAAALGRADRLGADLIIVGRGGGSVEDLWAFNEERVARAIFKAKTPVISAVGHETDLTIADLVADRRAATPSAAAEIAVPELSALRDRVGDLNERLGRAQMQRLRLHRLRLERLRSKVGASNRLLDRGRMRLDELHQRASARMVARISAARQALHHRRLALRDNQPQAKLARRRAALEANMASLTRLIMRRIERGRAQLGERVGPLDAMSPLSVLARGYCVAFDEVGTIVRAAAELAVGDALRLRLARGELACRVEAITESEEESSI